MIEKLRFYYYPLFMSGFMLGAAFVIPVQYSDPLYSEVVFIGCLLASVILFYASYRYNSKEKQEVNA